MGCDSDIFFECLVRIIDLNIYVPINDNLEGLAGVGAKAGNLNSKQFFGSNAQPQGHQNWSKEDKFPTSPTKTRGQKCFNFLRKPHPFLSTKSVRFFF